MIDALRSVDPLPRGVRLRSTRIVQTTDALSLDLGRVPSEEEIAAGTGLTLEQLRETRAFWGRSELSLEQLKGVDGMDNEGVTFAEQLADPLAVDPSAPVELRELHDVLAKAVAQLPPRELLIVSLYYQEELSMREIAAVLGVSESRVCQLHHRALGRLRASIAALRAA
jgi:RNA polymerase sigma factor for flagellar operon FliA